MMDKMRRKLEVIRDLATNCPGDFWEETVAMIRDEAESALTQQPESDPACDTCNDAGLIGGPTYSMPDEGGEPCPDCAGPQPTPQVPDELERLRAENTELKQWCRHYGAVMTKYSGNPCTCLAKDGEVHSEYCPVWSRNAPEPPEVQS